MADRPARASDPQEDGSVHVERVKVSRNDASSYEALRRTMNEKTRRGWSLMSMVTAPDGSSVELVWARDRREDTGS
jgi:hypothetical protein